jgi:hypothetical protein
MNTDESSAECGVRQHLKSENRKQKTEIAKNGKLKAES